METTIQLPDHLAERLHGRDADLPRILEEGLRVVDELDDESSADDLPAEWRDAMAYSVHERRQRATESGPSTEEIVAYAEGSLQADDEWMDRLVDDPEAVRDLADYLEFREPTMLPATGSKEALRRFRKELDRQGAAMPSQRPGWLALAAAVILTIGAAWMTLRLIETPSDPRYSTIVEVSTTRGTKPSPAATEGDVLLILPAEIEPAANESRRIRIRRLDGTTVYDEPYRSVLDPDRRLVLTLPHDVLRPGSYQVEVLSAPSDGPARVVQEHRFKLDADSP